MKSNYDIVSQDFRLITVRDRIAAWHEAKESVALCHGCFDLLHRGHVEHFREAAHFADRLVVTITPDGFVNKGPGRPVLPDVDRAIIIAAIRYVDAVAINEYPTASETLRRLRPDVYVKGVDYATESNSAGFIQEKEVAESCGIRLTFTGTMKLSSTDLLLRIRGERL